ncbi:MAG: PaaI family thioesterase [Deltaproteobacteria bacterium]
MTDRFEVASRFIKALPHVQALGIELIAIGDGSAEMSLPYDARLIGDPETGVIHGGAVSTLMDTCCGTAAMSHPTGALSTATLDLRIDYMRAATPGQTIKARAECYHVTRSVAFLRVVATDDDAANPVATAAAAFTLERAS